MRGVWFDLKIHIVQKGDTIWDIAQKYGVDFEQVKDLNPQLSSPDMIMPGMKIKIPSTTKQVKKEGVHPKEKPIKEQQVPHKPIQKIPEDDHQKPKEVQIKKPKHHEKEMPIMPEYPNMGMPELPKVPEYPKKEKPKAPPKAPEHPKKETPKAPPKAPEHPKKEKPIKKEEIKMPEIPSLQTPLETPQMPAFPKTECSDQQGKEMGEYMPPVPMPMPIPMMPCCYHHMIQPYQPCGCQHMHHHQSYQPCGCHHMFQQPMPVGGMNMEHHHPAPPYQMMNYPQEIGHQHAEIPSYPMELGHSANIEWPKESMHSQQNWQGSVPSYRDVNEKQSNHSTSIKKEQKDLGEKTFESPSYFREQTNYQSFPTPPIYPNYFPPAHDVHDESNHEEDD